MTENTVNIPLLRKAVEWAEAEAMKPPGLREWEQSLYVLPLTATDPSWGLKLSQEWINARRSDLGKLSECGTCYCVAGFVASTTGEPFKYDSAATIAAGALGLTTGQSHRLFDAENTIEDVRRIAEEIAGERL